MFKNLILLLVVFLSINLNGREWSYSGDTGPEKWSSFDKKNILCKIGKRQSPINLDWQKPKKQREINFFYKTNELNIIDNGHTIQVNFPKSSYSRIAGEKFELLQLHFHSLSEHTIGLIEFPMEIHFVHKNSAGKLAVVGVMVSEGESNPVLGKLWKGLSNKKIKADFNPSDLLPVKRTHYHYEGSLTTPPCSEGVNWNVFNTAIMASKEQIDAFRSYHGGNNRPIQNKYGRKVTNF